MVTVNLYFANWQADNISYLLKFKQNLQSDCFSSFEGAGKIGFPRMCAPSYLEKLLDCLNFWRRLENLSSFKNYYVSILPLLSFGQVILTSIWDCNQTLTHLALWHLLVNSSIVNNLWIQFDTVKSLEK